MLTVGRFAICGEWDSTPTPQGLLRIVMPPLGHVFGAGWHKHTQAALEALPQHVRSGCTFLDIGTGSGILCVAAKLLGAGKCTATELDRDALVAARRTFQANGIEVELIDGTFPDSTKEYDLAVCSISSDFAKERSHEVQFQAKRCLFIHDDASVEVL